MTQGPREQDCSQSGGNPDLRKSGKVIFLMQVLSRGISVRNEARSILYPLTWETRVPKSFWPEYISSFSFGFLLSLKVLHQLCIQLSNMFLSMKQVVWLLLPIVQAATVTYTIPTAAPTSAAALDVAPVGIS